MRENEKKGIVILIIVGVMLILCINIFKGNGKDTEVNKEKTNRINEEFVQVLQNGTKLNTSEELKQVKMIDGLQITNIQLTEKDGQTVLLADVTNTTNTDTRVIGINIIILDKQGKEIAKIPGVISPLKSGATKQLNVGITEDYSNAYDFKVEKQ